MTDISGLMPAPDECGTVIIRGPKGDPGEPGPPGASGVVTTVDPITVSGTGSSEDPYVVGLGLSEDAANAVTVGSDGGLYVPAVDGSETVVTAGTNIAVTGTGTAGDPYVIATTAVVTSVTAGDNTVDVTPESGDVVITANISAEPGNKLGTGNDGALYATGTTLTAADGTLTVTGDPSAGYQAAVNMSDDDNNTLTAGTDGGLYVPTSTAIGTDTYLIGDSLTRTGTGTAEDPYVLGVNISGDAGNTLTTGSDGALYTTGTNLAVQPGLTLTGDPATGYTVGVDLGHGYANLTTATTLTAEWLEIPISPVAGNHATVSGTQMTLQQPGVWYVTAQINANGGDSTGTLYVGAGGLSSGSTYAGADLASGTNRRYGVSVRGMVVSTGASAISVRGQFAHDSGTVYPVVNSAMLQAWCVQPMTSDEANSLGDSLPALDEL